MNKRAQVINLPPNLIKKIEISRPAAEQISTSLRTAILDMTLQPGQIISETEVGSAFGASRTPVREAFTLLRDQGLIVTYPSRGNFVSKLSILEIMGAQFVRESLEVSVAVLHCERGLPESAIEMIDANLVAQQTCVSAGNGPEFHLLDDRFHAIFADAVGHSRISTIIEREKARLDRLRTLSLGSPEYLAILLADHHQIFDAIRSGDRTKASENVQRHLRRVLDTLSAVCDEHHDYFEKQ